mgnify:CR=1 FL=1
MVTIIARIVLRDLGYEKNTPHFPYNRSDGYSYASTALFARGVCLSMPIMQCFATLYDAYKTALSWYAKSA